MIEQLINRIKDAYFDLDRDTERRGRFTGLTQVVTPGAILPSPSQVPAMPQQGYPSDMPQAPADMPQGAPQPAPEPSLLDLIGARR